jgi:hypothetical protein
MLHACLYTICFVFSYTSWRLYAFYRTNLLRRCHSAHSLFLLFLCFRIATQEIFSELDETKARIPIFPDTRRSPKMRRSGIRGRPHHGMARATPGRAMTRCGPWPTSWRRPSTYIIPSTGKPKGTDQFSTKPTASRRRRWCEIGRVQSSSRHTTREGNHRRKPSSSPWSPPEWCVSSLPLTMSP